MDTRDLPFLDEHVLAVDAPRDTVWAALEHQTASLGDERFGRLLAAEPRRGFMLAEREPLRRVALVGRHRFARYRLEFVLDDGPTGGTLVRARSFAAFPGVRGRIYRALVVGTRLHVLATRGILHAIGRRSRRPL